MRARYGFKKGLFAPNSVCYKYHFIHYCEKWKGNKTKSSVARQLPVFPDDEWNNRNNSSGNNSRVPGLQQHMPPEMNASVPSVSSSSGANPNNMMGIFTDEVSVRVFNSIHCIMFYLMISC